jgi:hypothetical protein
MKFIIRSEENGEELKEKEGTAFQCFAKPKTRCSQQPARQSGGREFGEMWTLRARA